MNKSIITCDNAPEAIGPYSQAVKVGQMIFISGQIPINPANGELVEGDIKTQTKQILDNINNILIAAGSSLDKVVKTTLYMSDLNNYNAINDVYCTCFNKDFPARAAVEVSRLPKDVQIEIDAIATV